MIHFAASDLHCVAKFVPQYVVGMIRETEQHASDEGVTCPYCVDYVCVIILRGIPCIFTSRPFMAIRRVMKFDGSCALCAPCADQYHTGMISPNTYRRGKQTYFGLVYFNLTI